VRLQQRNKAFVRPRRVADGVYGLGRIAVHFSSLRSRSIRSKRFNRAALQNDLNGGNDCND
jgi:hypothetical protein